VVAGDFNSWSAGRMQVVDNMVAALSLHALVYTNHNRTIVLGNPIDHIFYRGLEPIAHQVQSVSSSDHNPIEVTFRTI
jgi:endonuclease/exonuclease/phosphatase (EEP) superfamily protein YafD